MKIYLFLFYSKRFYSRTMAGTLPHLWLKLHQVAIFTPKYVHRGGPLIFLVIVMCPQNRGEMFYGWDWRDFWKGILYYWINIGSLIFVSKELDTWFTIHWVWCLECFILCFNLKHYIILNISLLFLSII